MRKLYLELIQEFNYRGIDGLDKENSPDLRGDYARTLLFKRAEYRNASNSNKQKRDEIYIQRKGHPDYYNLKKEKNDTETKRDALYKQLKDEKNLNNQEKEEKINKNDLNNSFDFDTLRDKRSEQLKDNKKIEDEINAHPDMKFFNHKLHRINSRLDEINTEFERSIQTDSVKVTPKYKDYTRDSKEQHALSNKLKKFEDEDDRNTPSFADRVFKAKGWTDEQKKKYFKLKDNETITTYASDKDKSISKKNKIFINPNGLMGYDDFGKISPMNDSNTISYYLNPNHNFFGKNPLHKMYKDIKTKEELKKDNSLIDKTPIENKKRYEEIQRKYTHAKLPEYSTFFDPFKETNTSDTDSDNKGKRSYNDKFKSNPNNKKEAPSRKVNIPKPLIRKNEKIAAIGTGITGAGLYGLNKYITHEDLNENDFMNPFITEPEDEDGLSLAHMLGVAGAIHVGQNIASSRMLNKKQGRQVGEQIFKPDNSTKTNVKSGLKYTVAPEVGMIHNAIQDHIDYLRHNDDKNKVKDLIIIKKALKGDFASVVNNKHFQNNPELQNFLKEKSVYEIH